MVPSYNVTQHVLNESKMVLLALKPGEVPQPIGKLNRSQKLIRSFISKVYLKDIKKQI